MREKGLDGWMFALREAYQAAGFCIQRDNICAAYLRTSFLKSATFALYSCLKYPLPSFQLEFATIEKGVEE